MVFAGSFIVPATPPIENAVMALEELCVKPEFEPPNILFPHPATKATISNNINQFNGLVKIPNFFILLLLLKFFK
jgi:hypothetical protein